MHVSVEVMDAHLQNNQTAEDILASPDRLKSKEQISQTVYTLSEFTESPCIAAVERKVIILGKNY